MNPVPRRKRRSPLAQRRAERELFFWTANRILLLVLGIATVVFLIAQMLQGHSPITLVEILRRWPAS